MARSEELLRHLDRISSFVGTADSLLRVSISRERQRTAAIFESVDRVKSSASEGNVFGAAGSAGEALSKTAKFLGFGPKAVGSVGDLPISQKINQNLELRFVQTKADHRKNRDEAIAKAPPVDGLIVPNDANKYGPSPNIRNPSLKPYSQSDGKDAVSKYEGKVFPFKIQNLAKVGRVDPNDTFEIFPAYIRTMAESIDVQWSEKSYFGRSEAVNIYAGAGRSLTMDFTLFATNNGEPIDTFDEEGYPIPVSDFQGVTISIPGFGVTTLDSTVMNNAISKTDLWRKIDFLSSLAYPAYDENDRYDRAPFIRLSIGHMYEDQLAVVQSINYSYEPLVWDINGEFYTPMFAVVNLQFKLLHDQSPGLDAEGRLSYEGSGGEKRFYTRTEFNGN